MGEAADGWEEDVLQHWFSLSEAAWWQADDERDREIRERFEGLWSAQAQRLPADFLATPRQALAAIILFDQFPRNMFRGHAQSFATDHLALAISEDAVERGYDHDLTKDERTFLYMPFEHSERREDQQRSVALFTAHGDPELLRFAQLHHEVIERFGRFPHRNALLGRQPRPDEIAAGDVKPW